MKGWILISLVVVVAYSLVWVFSNKVHIVVSIDRPVYSSCIDSTKQHQAGE